MCLSQLAAVPMSWRGAVTHHTLAHLLHDLYNVHVICHAVDCHVSDPLATDNTAATEEMAVQFFLAITPLSYTPFTPQSCRDERSTSFIV